MLRKLKIPRSNKFWSNFIQCRNLNNKTTWSLCLNTSCTYLLWFHCIKAILVTSIYIKLKHVRLDMWQANASALCASFRPDVRLTFLDRPSPDITLNINAALPVTYLPILNNYNRSRFAIIIHYRSGQTLIWLTLTIHGIRQVLKGEFETQIRSS